MEFSVIVPLIQNSFWLLALPFAAAIVAFVPQKYSRVRSVLTGFLLIMITSTIMLAPFTLAPGVYIDTRAVILSVGAFAFGLVPALMVGATAVVLRLYLGGIGMTAGVLMILCSVLIGLGWRHFVYPKIKRHKGLTIYLMMLIVSAVTLLCMLAIPGPYNIQALQSTWLIVMLAYPVLGAVESIMLLRMQETYRLQDKLKLSEERFRILFDQAPLAYESLDTDGCFLQVNQQWLKLFGYSRDEVIGKWIGDFIIPDFIDEYRRKFEYLKEHGHIETELVMTTKSGELRHINIVGRIRYNDQGEPERTHSILHDVTAQKLAQEEREASEEKYQRLYETMSQGVVHQAANGEIISANPAAERILGISFDQFKGKTPFDPQWKSIWEDYSEMTRTKHPTQIAMSTGKQAGPYVIGVFQPKLNEYIWLSVVVTPLFQQGETAPYQTYALFEDVTEQKKARQNYQQLFKQMQEGFAVHEIICDSKGKPVDYRFLAANPAFEAMTGLKADEIIGKTVREVIPGVEPYWIEIYGKVALTGEPAQFENYSASLDKYFMVNAYQPKPNQFACTFADITSRVLAEKEAESTLRRLQGLLDNFPGPIMILDKEGTCVGMSSYTLESINLPKDKLLNHKITEVMPSDIADKIELVISQALKGDRVLEQMDVFEVKGEERYFEGRFFPISGSDNEDILFGYIGIDITQRMIIEQALEESEKRYSSYIRNAPGGILLLDETGCLLEVNDAAAKIIGYTLEAMLNQNVLEFADQNAIKQGELMLRNLAAKGTMNGDIQYRHKDGSQRWANISGVRLSETRFLCFMCDVTDQKLATEKLIYANTHDALTGLVNRQFFAREAERLNTPGQMPLSIILADINGLKLINDSFGFAEGDRVVIQTAEFLRGFFREGDVLARTGGDDFSILLPKTDFRKAMEILYNIQKACGKYNAQISNASLHISLALGVGTKETIDDDWAEANKQAENYLNQQKLLEQRSSHSSILATIKATMMEKSHETEEHEERLARLARKVGDSMGLSEVDLNNMELLAELHDIGKVGISERVLNKPGKLNDEEWAEMKKHPEIGERIAMSNSNLAQIAYYILCHHERWDGTGYPQQLAGNEIPLLSRILSVVDAYDAMTQDRVY